MIRLPLIALLATACSPADKDAAPANTVTATPTPAPARSAPPAPVADVVPKPGELKTFRDWTVGCDNGVVCKMASLGPEDGEFPTVTMSVTREGGPRGTWQVELDGEQDPAGVAVDGKRLASGKRFAGADAEVIIAALANGTALTALDAKGAVVATLSLAGASAALRYIDAQQGRAGTVTAAVAKGSRPAGAVPAAPALPVVAAVTPGGVATKPSAAQIAAMRKGGGCDLDSFAGQTEPEVHALGGGATLVLVPCSAGAYNLSSALYVLKDGKVAGVQVDAPSGFGFDDVAGPMQPAQIVNGDFSDGLLTSYAKGRGLGDCGVAQDMAWDGRRMRLVHQALMGECRGNTDLITTWRARVVRR